jgi:MFS transporter, Spinster family, sphingosine-1-phosphate transporter
MTDAAEHAQRKSANFSLGLLLAINLFNYIDRYVLAAIEPRIAKEFFGPNDPSALQKTGSLATAFIITYMIAAPIFGWLADRTSRWLLVGIGVILWSLASGASGLATTFSALLITRLFVGIGEAGYGPAAPTIIADLYPIERRGSVMAWFYMAIPVGSAIGYAWGGKFDAWFGWRWAFYAVVPPGILLGIFCLFRRDVRQAKSATRHRPGLKEYVSLFRNKSYLLDCAGMTAMTFAIGGVSFWMPHYLAEYRQVGTLEHANFVFGVISAIAGVTATLLGGIAGDLLRRHMSGAYFIVSGVGILISCPFVLLMLRMPFPAAWGALFCAVFFLFFNTGPSNTILANVTPASVRATAFAMNIFLIHILGDAISPPLIGRIVGSQQHWDRAFIVVTSTMALAALLWLWGARYLDSDTKLAAAEDAA